MSQSQDTLETSDGTEDARKHPAGDDDRTAADRDSTSCQDSDSTSLNELPGIS